MFLDACVFNQPLNSWQTGLVENMDNMFSPFRGGTFNQNIDSWQVDPAVGARKGLVCHTNCGTN